MAGLDPLTAREGLRTAREVVSGRQISYPIPYLVGLFFGLCVACLIVALFAQDIVRSAAVAIGSAAFLTGVGITIYALVGRADLLRSERHQQAMRLIEMVGDKETTPDVRGSAAEVLMAVREPKTKRGRDKEDGDDR